MEMPSWLAAAWKLIKDPDNRTVNAWLGGGIAAAAAGVWAVIKFFAGRKKDKDKSGGADRRQIGEAVFEAQRPLIDWVKELSAENAGLLRQLEAARKAPQTLGSEQALAEAIHYAEKQAEAGQPRAAEALALLAAGKVAEAIPLFEAEAVEKKTTSRANAKEVAAAYRHLGAIAGLADPKRALEAYEEAVALDPDDIASLYWAGAILVDYGDLTNAQKRLERVSKLAGTGDQPFYKCWALTCLGDIKQKRGDLSGALKSFLNGLAIIDLLAKSDPGNAGWQYALGMSNGRIGGVQIAQGDLGAALKSYETNRDIIYGLANSDPGNAGWQRDLSVALNKVGGVQKDQGDLLGALKSYSDSLAIRELLAKSDPGNAQWQRNLSVAHCFVGNVQVAQGDLDGALKSYGDYVATAELLAKSDPGNAVWQRDLSVSYSKIGDILVAQGNLPEALKTYQAGLAIADLLAKSDPDNAGWQRDLSVSFGKLADVHKQSGDKAKARDDLRQGQAIMARLTKLSPDNAVWKRDLAWFDRRLKELAP